MARYQDVPPAIKFSKTNVNTVLEEYIKSGLLQSSRKCKHGAYAPHPPSLPLLTPPPPTLLRYCDSCYNFVSCYCKLLRTTLRYANMCIFLSSPMKYSPFGACILLSLLRGRCSRSSSCKQHSDILFILCSI